MNTPANSPPESLRLLSRWHKHDVQLRPVEREAGAGELVVCGALARAFAVFVDHETAAAGTGGAVVVLYGDHEGDGLHPEALAIAYVPPNSKRPVRAFLVRAAGYRSYRLRISSQQGASRVVVVADADQGGGNSSIVQVPSGLIAFANAGWVAPANLPAIEKAAEQITQQVSQVSSTGTEVWPAPAAMADATANPTVTRVAAYGMAWNGVTWGRLRAIEVNDGADPLGHSLEVASFGLIYDADTGVWDRLRKTSAGSDAIAPPSGANVNAVLRAFNGVTVDRVRAGVTALASTFVGYLNVLAYAIYEATPSTRTDGQGGPLRSDSRGALRVNGNRGPGASTAIVPGDATVIDCPGGIWVGTAGNLVGRLKDDASDRTFKVAANSYLPGWFIAVRATGTTAADLVGYGV